MGDGGTTVGSTASVCGLLETGSPGRGRDGAVRGAYHFVLCGHGLNHAQFGHVFVEAKLVAVADSVGPTVRVVFFPPRFG